MGEEKISTVVHVCTQADNINRLLERRAEDGANYRHVHDRLVELIELSNESVKREAGYREEFFRMLLEQQKLAAVTAGTMNQMADAIAGFGKRLKQFWVIFGSTVAGSYALTLSLHGWAEVMKAVKGLFL
jgi:hypothetical protein